MPESLFNNVTGNFFKKETLAQVFFREFCKNFKNNCFYRTPLLAVLIAVKCRFQSYANLNELLDFYSP